jgi:hypothetical protein
VGWSALTLCTDADLGSLEPAATNGQWKNVTWPNQRAEAKRDLKIKLEVDFPQIPDVADRVKDTHIAEALYGYTGGVYTDISSPAATISTENDVNLSSIFVTPASDRIYLGSLGEFDGIYVRQLDRLNAVASTLTVKYSGPTGWTALTALNGTASTTATFAKSGRITWTVPSNWERRTLVTADPMFWIELSVSAGLTANTAATQILLVKAPDPLKRIVALQALGYIVQNLAANSPSVDYYNGRARNQFKTGYMDLADALYASLRDKGGIPLDTDGDEAVSEGEQNTISPVRLGRA